MHKEIEKYNKRELSINKVVNQDGSISIINENNEEIDRFYDEVDGYSKYRKSNLKSDAKYLLNRGVNNIIDDFKNQVHKEVNNKLDDEFDKKLKDRYEEINNEIKNEKILFSNTNSRENALNPLNDKGEESDFLSEI